ncbi:MAG: carboxypeptidase regulatory-like domain-containing protein, partial [Bryobacteraceae bacterium]
MRFAFSKNGAIALALCAASLLFFPQQALAQLSTASVTGAVRDPSGASVPDAQVALRNLDTAVERRAATNAAGNYVFVSVPPGRYSLEIGKAGFRSTQIPELTLEVNQTATADATLAVGAVQQTVEVAASAEMIQSATAELGAVISEKQVVDLPLNGRNFTQLLSLTPGAAPINGPQQSNGFGNTAIGTAYSFPAFNGQQNRSNFFMTDGLNNQAAFASTYVVPPIIDDVQEFKVNSHNDQAEFGGSLGGIVNVVTKSGTNEYHGDLWEYLRNTDLNARGTFDPAVTPFHQNQYGVTFGGPVSIPKLYDGHNKTFFFFGYESFRYSQSNFGFIRVPTPLELSGNFTGPNEPKQIFNPFTTRPDPSNPNVFIRDPFPGNIIPQSLLDPRMVSYAQALLPKPVFTGVSDRNAINTDPTIQAQDEYTGRVDQNIGTKNFIWFRWSNIILDQVLATNLPGLDENTHNPGLNWGLS